MGSADCWNTWQTRKHTEARVTITDQLSTAVREGVLEEVRIEP